METLKIRDIEEYINDNLLDDIFKSREDSIYQRNKKEINEICKIKERYPIDYEQLLNCIKNIPPHFNNIRNNIIDALDTYSMRENLLTGYDNEKFYKIGFCDGIRIMLENLKINSGN